MKIVKWITLLFLMAGNMVYAQSFEDEVYLQPVSKTYLVKGTDADLKMKKMVIDRDDNVYALTDRGLFIIIGDYLVRDQRYRPLADKKPVDITIQSNTGILYYLYEDHYLSNAHAGKPWGKFEKGKYTQIAVNESGEVLLTGPNDFALIAGDGSTTGSVAETIKEVKAYNGTFFILTDMGISQYRDDGYHEVIDDPAIISWAFGEDELFLSTDKGYYSVSTDSWEEVKSLRTKLPVIPATSIVYQDGKLWAGSDMGMYATQNYDDYSYYASRRWLADDKVLDVAVDSEGNAYALMDQGISEVYFKEMTLKQKADYFHEKIRKRHLRYGLIGEVRLSKAGDLTTTEMVDTDNDGLWTSFYLGSEVFRYATTGNPVAKKNAFQSFEAFERLLSINALDGFPSRTFERKGYKISDADRWRPSPQEQWEWKGHTSSDEFVAYIWVAGIMNQYLDLTKEEKNRVTHFIDQIMMHIIDNDYYFVDIDGKPTLWGRWNPEYLNWYAKSVVDRKLGSTTITAGLQLAYALTGKEMYKKEIYRLFEEHGYLENIKIPMEKIESTPGYIYKGHNMGEGGWNHSDDEMAFLTYWVLYHYALNEDLQQTYANVIADHWVIEKSERNSLWSLIAYGTSGDIDLASVKWHLREFQLDMVRWNVQNSHRKDLDFLEPNFRNQTIREVLPPGERETVRYNANPFELDGGDNGMRVLAGDEYLLPYWMGRYLNVIVPTNNNKKSYD